MGFNTFETYRLQFVIHWLCMKGIFVKIPSAATTSWWTFIISASLFINLIERISARLTDLSPRQSVSWPVCTESVLQQNGWLDLDAVCGWSRDGFY